MISMWKLQVLFIYTHIYIYMLSIAQGYRRLLWSMNPESGRRNRNNWQVIGLAWDAPRPGARAKRIGIIIGTTTGYPSIRETGLETINIVRTTPHYKLKVLGGAKAQHMYTKGSLNHNDICETRVRALGSPFTFALDRSPFTLGRLAGGHRRERVGARCRHR